MTVMMHHQTAMRLRQQLRTVHNPLVRAHAREMVSLSSPHPDVIAHKNVTNTGNKCSFSITKSDDTIALKYFADIKDVELTWAESIFNDGVGVDSADVGRVGGKRGPGESS